MPLSNRSDGDYGMDPPQRPIPGRGSGSPVGSLLTIVFAVIATLVGLLILRSISDDTSAVGGGGLSSGDVALGVTTTVGAQTTPAPGGGDTTSASTPAERVTEGGTIVVANASRVDGAATELTVLLEESGYRTGDPTNDNADEDREDSIVYFQPGSNTETVARSVALDLGGIEVAPMPAEIPTASGDLSGDILVVLGNDVAGTDELPGPPPAAPQAPPTAADTTPTNLAN